MQNTVTQGDQVFINVELLSEAIATIKENLMKLYAGEEQFVFGGQTVAAGLVLYITERLTEEK